MGFSVCLFLFRRPSLPFVSALSLPLICRFFARLSVRSCALLCQRSFFVFTAFFYLYPPLPALTLFVYACLFLAIFLLVIFLSATPLSEAPLPAQKQSPACRGALLLLFVFLRTVSRRHQPPTPFRLRWFDAAHRCPSPSRSADVAAPVGRGCGCQTTGISFSPSARDSSVGGASLSSPFI